jgi:hypothetical protein
MSSIITKNLILLSLSLCAIGGAKAQTFSNGTFTTNEVLSLAGTTAQEVYGVDVEGSSSSTTSNGYTFVASGPNSAGEADITGIDDVSSSNGGGGDFGFIPTGVSTGDTTFDSILDTGTYTDTPETYTLNKLVGGDTYSVLIFSADNRGGAGDTRFSITDGGATSSSQNYFFPGGSGGTSSNGESQAEGGYVIDTFTEGAGDTSHDITVGNNYELEGVLVENVTPTTTTPEPSTFALLGLGTLALGLVSRRAFLKA